MDRLLEATARAERDHFWFRGFRKFVEPLIAEASEARPLQILDCGCGTGHNLTMLRPYGRASGIDLAWAGLRYARTRGERRLARATAACLPFPDETFDLITSFDVLYSLHEQAERDAIAEMFRVLRPGGRLVVTVAALDALRGGYHGLHLDRAQAERLVQTPEAVAAQVDGDVLIAERAQLAIDRFGDLGVERAGNLVSPELDPRDRVVVAHTEDSKSVTVQHALGRFDRTKLLVGDLCVVRNPRRE